MTDKEAKAILIDKVKPCLNGTEWEMALDIAIKALEQEPREITLDDVKGYCKPRNLTIITNELLYELTHRCGVKMAESEEKE